MLERDFAIFHLFSKGIIDRRIAMPISGVMFNTATKSETSFLVGTLYLLGMLVLGLFLLLIPV